MKIKLTGVRFRKTNLSLELGRDLLILPDPHGSCTGQDHDDKNALSVWYPSNQEGVPALFIGYIPKKHNQNNFKSAVVSYVWYKDEVSPFHTEYKKGRIVGGIEIDCDGDFQITTEEGRIYEKSGEEYESITSFLSRAFPGDPDNLMRWAFQKYNTYDEYKKGLDEYASSGTQMHETIENYLIARKEKGEDSKEATVAWGSLSDNIKTFFTSLGDFEVVDIEGRVYDDVLSLAGTADAVLRINGDLIVFDWKSSKSVQNKHKVQSGFYGKNKDCKLACVVCFGADNKQGYSVSKVSIDNTYKYLTLLKQADNIAKSFTYKGK